MTGPRSRFSVGIHAQGSDHVNHASRGHQHLTVSLLTMNYVDFQDRISTPQRLLGAIENNRTQCAQAIFYEW
jgi:hypothetical protein